MTARKSKQTARVYFYVSCSCVFTDRGWDIQTYTGGWFSHVLPPNRWSISLKLVYVYVARVDTTWGIESFVRIQYAYHVQPRSRGGK
jgi:hypothetical protein